MPGATTRPLRVGLYGFFGMGNLGDGAPGGVPRAPAGQHPDVRSSASGRTPRRSSASTASPGGRLMAFRAVAGDRRPATQARKALGRLWDVPRTFRMVGQVDVLVVPGTGVLESRLMMTPWGLPYWMAVAFTACRLLADGPPLSSASVRNRRPTPPPACCCGRWCGPATHVTYRDAASAQAARDMGAPGRPGTVAPDVAFALPDPVGVAVRPGHVVVGVMTYWGPRTTRAGAGRRRGLRAAHDAGGGAAPGCRAHRHVPRR